MKKFPVVFFSFVLSLMLSGCENSEVSAADNEYKFPLRLSCGTDGLPKKWEDGVVFTLQKNKTVLISEAPKPGQPTLMMSGGWNTTLEDITFTLNGGIMGSSVIPLKTPRILKFGKIKNLSQKLPDGDTAISFKNISGSNILEYQCIVPSDADWVIERPKKVESTPEVEKAVKKAEPVIVEEPKEEAPENRKVIESAPVAVPNYRPSFSCNEKLTKNERLICDSQELSKLDSEMAAAYKNALNQAEFDPIIIKNEQRAWRKKRDAECIDEKCLISSYKNRLNAF